VSALAELQTLSPVPWPEKPESTERLHAYLNAYWLRPENALWMTLRSLVLDEVDLRSPAADLSCGDGLFTFLHRGGRLHESFDVFESVAHLDRVTDQHADMFDHAATGYAPTVTQRPETTVAIGTDLKASMLSKAAALRFYERLIEHDSNRPLPLEDGSLASVYCNSAYWVRNIDGFLRELRRVTRDTGLIVLHVKLSDMQRYTLAALRDSLGDRFLEILGRGRIECWPTVCSRGEWERRFTAAGLRIQSATPFVTRTHAHMWDIGLRPIAPLLVRMANGLTPATRLEIKRDWTELMLELLTPLCRPDLHLLGGFGEPAEIQYVLSPCR
jgi:SAM-dependent methyltransferase